MHLCSNIYRHRKRVSHQFYCKLVFLREYLKKNGTANISLDEKPHCEMKTVCKLLFALTN